MSHRSPARWLAPLALFLVAMAVAAVVGQSLRPDEPSRSASSTSPAATTRAVSDDGEGRSKTRRRTYRVRSGDTLTSISIKTGVPLERLRALNPEVDSDALQTGQRIKLRR